MTLETYYTVDYAPYKNPNVPFINMAGVKWVPLSLAMVFDKCRLYNPHMISSRIRRDEEPGLDVFTTWRALERHDELWDIIHFEQKRPPENNLQASFWNSIDTVLSESLVTEGVTRDVAQQIIDEFNSKLTMKNDPNGPSVSRG